MCSIWVVHGGTAVDPPLGGSRYFMWSCFSQSLAMVCDPDGMCSIWVVHGGTAGDPPLGRQQVLHVVLL